MAVAAAMGIGGISVPMNAKAAGQTATENVYLDPSSDASSNPLSDATSNSVSDASLGSSTDSYANASSDASLSLSSNDSSYVSSMSDFDGFKFIEIPDLVSQLDAQKTTSSRRAMRRYSALRSASRKSGSCDYFYNQMNDAQKALYDALDTEANNFLNYTVNGKKVTDKNNNIYYVLPNDTKTTLSLDEASVVVKIFYLENPEYYFLDHSFVWASSNGGLSINAGIYKNFVNVSDRQTATSNINSKVSSYLTEIKQGTSITDKEKKAHDIIVRDTIYGQDMTYHQSAAGVFLENKAVCAGYCAAFQYLMDKIGIPCVTITSENHAWNEVQIDGKWYIVDVTWDDTAITTKYFNVGMDVFNEEGKTQHTPESFWTTYNFTRPIDSKASEGGDDDNAGNNNGNAGNDNGNAGNNNGNAGNNNGNAGNNNGNAGNNDGNAGNNNGNANNNNGNANNNNNAANTPQPTPQPQVNPVVNYQAHVQNIGWQGAVSNGTIAGTTGRSLRVEAIKMSISGDSNLGISYQAHVQDIGWQNPVSNGNIAGTTGRGKRVEALRINLTGSDASKFDVYYCIHSENYGWFNWVKNGETTGTSGLSYRVEAFAVKILPKGSAAPARLGNLTIGHVDSTTTLSYSAHVQNIGWQGAVSNGAVAGTTGRSLRVEALKINKAGASMSGSVSYKAHVQNIGWMNPVSDGAVAGTSGRSLRVEALSISLNGELSQAFNVYYRVHVQNIGWTGWACNGAYCGSHGRSLRVEAVQIVLVAKGKPAPGSTGGAYY